MNGTRNAREQVGSALTQADYASLARRWIDRTLAESAGIRRVASYEGALYVGRRDNGSYDGLLIPYFLPGETRVREWRLRRDRPDIEYKDEKPREINKYLSPPGRSNMLYFMPGVSLEVLRRADVPVIVTEGEFKVLALDRLANHESASPRFLPVGPPGVWNWRGTVGKTTGPDGDRRDKKGPIPDLGLISWEGRRVIIAFDADAETNQQVEAARIHLTRELRMRGAEVASVTWDIAQGKGIDDLLANVGPEKVLELLASADFGGEQADDRVSVYHLAEAITGRYHFAQDVGGKLYVYRGGCYQADGPPFVRQQVKRLMERMGIAGKWTSHKADEVVKYIAVDSPVLWERPPLGQINIQNGLLDITSRRLAPHSPEYLSSVQFPVKYDPDARCPSWDKFTAEVFPGDAEAIAWETLAWLMTPDSSIQKAILLIGDGANGKSTYLRAVLAFVGGRNVAAVSLHKLENDRFSVARLVGKLANICPDLPGTDLTSTSVFKAITGGDAMLAERKFEQSFEFIPFARLIFSANHPPKSQDASPAFFRRWLVVPFERMFPDGGASTIPREQLDAALADPGELSGVLNKALAALVSIRRRGFTDSESTRRAIDEFRQATDPLSVWLDRNTVVRSDALVPMDTLWMEYNRECTAKGRPMVSKAALGRAMVQLRPSIEKLQRTVNDSVAWCYVGIGFLLKGHE